jgi:ABC-type dipeptide/oligopeptide/nickel transport system permease component
VNWGRLLSTQGRSVNEILFSGLPVTAELGFYALLIALIIGVTAGVLASLKPNTRQDYIPMSLAMIGICMPSFLLGPLLVLVFGIYLEWLPISGWGSIPGDKILPSITLGAAYAAYVARLSRAGMLEILSQDYIRTARAKGLPEWQGGEQARFARRPDPCHRLPRPCLRRATRRILCGRNHFSNSRFRDDSTCKPPLTVTTP